jgi:hypothetical protein
MSHTLVFLNLVYLPILRVLVSVGVLATQLAETGTKSCHVVAAAVAASVSSIPEVMSYKDVLASNEHLLAKITNTHIHKFQEFN